MKKAYRVLQWTMLMGTAAVMASACVVTSGDGDNDDSFFDGGEGGTSSTAGKKSTEGGEGGTTEGGKASGGSTSAGTSAGGSTAGGSGGSGGSGVPAYVPGVCEGAEEPTSLPVCTPTKNDEGEPCTLCMKAQCCDAWQTCYGDTPTSACGWGETEEAPGQFDCIQFCYLDGLADATDLMQLQSDCADKCLNQCEDGVNDMGFVTDITQDLLICVNDKCLDECFPAE